MLQKTLGCKNGCQRIPVDELHENFAGLLKTFTFNEDAQILYESILKNLFKQGNADRTSQQEHARKQIAIIKAKQGKSVRLLLDGHISESSYTDIKGELAKEREDLEFLLREEVSVESEFSGYLKKASHC